jgi:sterol desaturase/sphingolipid hydroxylase (fatty acid hydroxylase superfamily)
MAYAPWILALAVIMMAAERLWPGRRWAQVSGWWPRAIALNLVQVISALLAGSLYDGWLLKQRPWSADALGTLGGAAVGYVAITFVYYWWHRARHEVQWLWRWFHQVHHSPSRIEIATSFYKHPVEIAVNGVLSSAIVYLGVGLGVEAATLAVALTGVAELFYHWNVSTPRWIGWVIQRPESHCVHHQEGLHHYNYSDLPLWDFLFGTLHNPERFDARCGFGPGFEQQLGPMLLGRVLEPTAAPGADR